jgi:hypothetical protein
LSSSASAFLTLLPSFTTTPQGTRAVLVESENPHLVSLNLNDDLVTGIVMFHLHQGITRIGKPNVDPLQDIEIDGPGVENEQCIIDYDGSEKVREVVVCGGWWWVVDPLTQRSMAWASRTSSASLSMMAQIRWVTACGGVRWLLVGGGSVTGHRDRWPGRRERAVHYWV